MQDQHTSAQHGTAWNNLTRCERQVFGVSDIEPMTGLQQRNADLVPARSARYPYDEALMPAEGWAFVLALALFVSPTVIDHVKTSPAHEGTREALRAVSAFIAGPDRSQSVNTFVRGAK